MGLFRQLEFIFRGTDSLTSILSLREGRTTKSPGEGRSNALRVGPDVDLEFKARQLLRELGAIKLAREVRVEWNPRMRTAAGRAGYRKKLISLNPLLRSVRVEQTDGKLDCLKQSSLTSAREGELHRNQRGAVAVRDEIDRTLRHELAHLLAQFRVGRRRIAPHGNEWRRACSDLGIADEARCHNLPFASKSYPARYVYRCPNCKREFPRVRRIRAIACLSCCRKHNGGDFDSRFKLKLVNGAHQNALV